MKVKLIGFACAAVLGLAAASASTSAMAMPNGLNKLAVVSPDAQTEQVRWVCGPRGRCWWRPNYYGAYGYYGGGPGFYGPGFYGRGFYGRGWGWRGRGWRRW